MVEDKGLPGPVADKIGEMVVLRYAKPENKCFSYGECLVC